MTRRNAFFQSNATYGATAAGSRLPPPPYPGPTQPIDGSYLPNVGFPLDPPVSARHYGLPPRIRESVARMLRTRSSLVLLTFLVTLGLCMRTMPVTYCNDPADPQVRERIREEWSKELFEHEKQVADREVVEARWAWQDKQHAKLIREWEEEQIKHERDLEKHARREEEEHRLARALWALEEEQHTRLVREWESERIRHERELKERARREEEERIRLNLFWGHVGTQGCKTYGTREYTAVLMNLPTHWGLRVEACRATPLEIHGTPHLPKTCEDRGLGGMIGVFEVSQQEPKCSPFWDSYNDKGCTSPGSGKKFVTQKLENIPEDSDWEELCATTPAHLNHLQFPGAQECIDSIWGKYGQWEIDDHSC